MSYYVLSKIHLDARLSASKFAFRSRFSKSPFEVFLLYKDPLYTLFLFSFRFFSCNSGHFFSFYYSIILCTSIAQKKDANNVNNVNNNNNGQHLNNVKIWRQQ